MVEMTARAFENFVESRMSQNNAKNDFLVQPIESLSSGFPGGREADSFPYLTQQEIDNVTPLFDNLFKTIKAKEDNNRTILYQSSGLEVEPRALGLSSDIIAASNEAQDNMAEDGQITVRYQQKYGPIEYSISLA
jgi:hypothetical protein